MANVSFDSWAHRGTLYCEGQDTGEATSTATPQKIIAPTFSKKGDTGLTVDTTNSMFTIATAGDYLVTVSISFSGTLSETYNVTIYQEAVSSNLTLERKLGTGGDVGSASVSGLITCVAGEDVSLYQSTAGGSAFKVSDLQMTMVRLG